MPLAIFGAPLDGLKPVRYVFVDEAGVSAREPICVVVGIIMHADEHAVAAEKAIGRVLSRIPPSVRSIMPVFHAKKIWGDEKLREQWPFKDRLALLNAMMSIPQELDLALAIGACPQISSDEPITGNISLSDLRHAAAFQQCMAHADHWIRDFAKKDEVATVIAEDVPNTKKLLKHAVNYLKNHSIIIQPENMRMSRVGELPPIVADAKFREKKITRIRLPIHFAEKHEEPLLQIADACAFGFRRFFSEQSHGADFVKAILGYDADLPSFGLEGPSGGMFAWYQEKMKVNYVFGPWRG